MINIKRNDINDLLFILVCSLFVALSIVLFLVPHKIAAGGPPGVAILLNYFTGISFGWGMILINIPLIAIGYKKFGRLYFSKLIIAIITVSLFTDVSFSLFNNVIITDYRLVNAILGGFTAGLGIGLISVAGTASSGWVALAQVIAVTFKLPVGKTCFALDSIILVSFAVVFREIETAIYGFITIYIVGRTIDFIINKFAKKAAQDKIQTVL